jgi:hypothetical protein
MRYQSLIAGGGSPGLRAPGALTRGFRPRLLKKCALILAAASLVGCHTPDAKKPTSAPTTASTQLTFNIKPIGSDPRDPKPAPGEIIRLVIFTIDLPTGCISDNSNFWKRVDEQAVGAENHDRLLRNGIRCGIVPPGESAFFSRFFDSQPHKMSVARVESFSTQTLPLQLDRHVDREDLFVFTPNGKIEGRSFDRATNELMLTFGFNPTDSKAIHLTLCPQVRSERLRLEYSALNQEFETPLKDVERLYDVGLTADVRDGSFLIIAPSVDADRKTSIGGRFLTRPDDTQRSEQVILIVPTLLPLDGTPVTVRPELVR